MKIYEIYDFETALSIGVLLYYEKEKTFIIELQDHLDEWNCPLLFTGLVKRGIFSVSRELSRMWVTERIIPSGRQNIGSILSNHKLKEYDEMRFLELSEGRCSQDNLLIRKLNALPSFVKKRMKHNILDCTVLNSGYLLCFFRDNSIRKISLKDLKDIDDVDKLKANKQLFDSCTLGTDGFYLTFGNSIDIPAYALIEKGQPIPLSYEDFLSFSKSNIIDTSASCDLLECSRQNLAHMVSQGQLPVFKENTKGNQYLKKDILKMKW